MADILQEIIAQKRLEVERQKKIVSPELLEGYISSALKRNGRSLRAVLEASPTGIIAEFKRKSPSKGWIFLGADVEKVLPAYELAGASACSVLTDYPFFGGSLDDLQTARQFVALPLLRKEFIIDPYQLVEARIAGADAVLLIASVLTPEMCFDLAEAANGLQMEVLLEVHTENELGHLNQFINLIGINNRNLGTFDTSLDHSFRLAEKVLQLNSSAVLVSESGISKPSTVNELRKCGFRGFLIGENFMRTGTPGETLTEFMKGLGHDH